MPHQPLQSTGQCGQLLGGSCQNPTLCRHLILQSYGPWETSDVGGNRGGELLLILQGKTRDFQSLSST